MKAKPFVYILLGIFLLTACNGASESPVENTKTPRPTQPPPTEIYIPPTPRPTAVPPLEPPEEIIIALRDYELISQELEPNLDDYYHENAAEVDGTIEVMGEGWVVSKYTLEQPQAILIQFSEERSDEGNLDYVIDLRTGDDFASEGFYSMGFTGNNETIIAENGDFQAGVPFDGSLVLDGYSKSYALLTVDSGGVFLIYIWDDDRYSQISSLALGENWIGKEWQLNVWVGEGNISIDRVDIYSFSEINIVENESNWGGDWWFRGIAGGGYNFQLTQTGAEIEGEVLGGIVTGSKFLIEGTAFGYDDPILGYYDVLRGTYFIEDSEHPGQYGIIWADWRMLDNGYQICGRGHGGGSVQELVRVGYGDYPGWDVCDWYYYEEDFFISQEDADLEWSIYEKGMQGIEVEVLQLMLRNIGYEITVDGDFGPGTEAVVKSFQTDNDLDVDGIVGSETWLILSNKNLLSVGDEGDHVSALQIILSDKFGYEISVDGDFGPNTEGFVETFQADNGISVDGVVRIDTWHALISAEGEQASAEEPISFIIENQSNSDICFIYISPSEDNDWGENWIDENNPIISGNQVSIEAPSGMHNLLAEDCDHVRLGEMNTDVVEDFTWTISPPAMAHLLAVVNTFNDSFTKNFPDWNFFSLDGSAVDANISDGYLNISTNEISSRTYGMLARSEFPPAYQDINIFAKAELENPHAVTGFICRASEAGWYEILFTSYDGYWIVLKKDSAGNFTELGAGFLDGVIGETSLDFKLVCADGMIELGVNDFTTTTVFDTSFDTGAVGVVGATDIGDTVHFDQFFVIWMGGM